MRRFTFLFSGLILLLLFVFLLVGGFLFSVGEWEQAVVVEFGKVVKVVKEPGLHIKKPFIQKIIRVDKRLLNYDIEPREVITKDKKRLTVDNYVLWKIDDPKLYVETTRGIRIKAETRLDDVVYSTVRDVIGDFSFAEVVSLRRDEIMIKITKMCAAQMKAFGISVVDVRIKRTDLPEATEQAVYARMKSERERIAAAYRAEGKEKAKKIRSQADRDAQIILAEARRKAEEIKGQGDAEALRIYNEAYLQAPEFYRFFRIMEAYPIIFSGDTTIFLDTDSAILKYLKKGWE